MIDIIQLSSNYWLWFAIAIILMIAEVTIGGNFFLLWIGISSLLVAILQWLIPAINWQYQWLIFSAVSISSILLWWQYLKKRSSQAKQTHLNSGAERFLGKIYTLVEPIQNGKGKVKVGDSVWLVMGPDLSVGTRVKVVGIEGVFLKVQPAE